MLRRRPLLTAPHQPVRGYDREANMIRALQMLLQRNLTKLERTQGSLLGKEGILSPPVRITGPPFQGEGTVTQPKQ